MPLKPAQSLPVTPIDLSAKEALLLARRNWLVLVFIPVIICGVSTFAYTRVPTSFTAIAVLNTDLGAVSQAAERMNSQSGEDANFNIERISDSAVVVSMTSADSAAAAEALEGLIELVPPNVAQRSQLPPGQQLELRAQREYLTVLEAKLADIADQSSADAGLLRQELSQVETRIAALAALDIEAEAVPLVGKAVATVPKRTPPLRNVIVFSLLAALFATWTGVYFLEVRRLRRQAAGTLAD